LTKSVKIVIPFFQLKFICPDKNPTASRTKNPLSEKFNLPGILQISVILYPASYSRNFWFLNHNVELST